MAKKTEVKGGEWVTVIKAQDETSKLLMKQENEIKQQSKLLYKAELDKQLNEKHKILKEYSVDKQDELKFLKAQQEAVKQFENNKKIEDRSYQNLYYRANQGELKLKNTKTLQEIQEEKQIEQKRLQQIKELEDKEKQDEFINKKKLLAEQKIILAQQIEEKQRKFELERKEKESEKAMINKSIEEMKIKEQSYKNFYAQRMAALEKKSKLFQSVAEKDSIHQELINKRNAE